MMNIELKAKKQIHYATMMLQAKYKQKDRMTDGHLQKLVAQCSSSFCSLFNSISGQIWHSNVKYVIEVVRLKIES